ncbi:MAG: arylamine N-acetyltransferase [Actinomycetota bacterium]
MRDDLPELTAAERAAYLDRIGLGTADPVGEPGLDLLTRLQLAHLLTVPFENLDIHLGRGISLEPGRVLAKVVGERRGGYCYELNSAFARLLRSLGFDVTLVSVRIPYDRGGLSPEFDHLAMLVAAAAGGERHLVDVGFGDAFTVPLPLRSGAEVADRDHRVRLTDHGDHWDYEEDRGGGWRLWYRFTTTPQDLGAFEGMNRFQESSPESHFTGTRICTRLTPTGRLTLSDRRLIETVVGGDRSERSLAEADVSPLLADEFGVVVPAAPSLVDLIGQLPADPAITLATNGPSGRPRLTLVGGRVDGDVLRIRIDDAAPAVDDLRRDGRCTVLLAGPDPSSPPVEVRGWAALDDAAGADATDAPDHAADAVDAVDAGGATAGGRRVIVRPQEVVIADDAV